MASTNKTPNYDLPQFIASDKPTWLGDINGAMLAIDTGMQANKLAAESAESAATSAQGSANAAQQAAQDAAKSSQSAVEAAQGAQTTATSAISTATSASTKAEQAISDAATASSQAQSAQSTASSAQSAASSAQTAAGAAATAANQAKTIAESAMDVANGAQDDIANIGVVKVPSGIGSRELFFKPTLKIIFLGKSNKITDTLANLNWKSGNYGYWAAHLTTRNLQFWNSTQVPQLDISFDYADLEEEPSSRNSFKFPCAVFNSSGYLMSSVNVDGYVCRALDDSIWVLYHFNSGSLASGSYTIIPIGAAIWNP